MQLTEKQVRALNNVVDYLFLDELKSYEEDGKPEEHIFLDVQILDDLTKEFGDTKHRLQQAKKQLDCTCKHLMIGDCKDDYNCDCPRHSHD